MSAQIEKNQTNIGLRKDVTNEFRQFFLHELKHMYWGEKELVNILPNISKNAFATRLMDALKTHLKISKTHAQRLEQIFKKLGEAPDTETCQAMKGLISEAEDLVDDTQEDLIRDAGIILAIQKICHFEIATYGTMVSFAKTMGQTEIAELLQKTLDEEKQTDQTLSDIAEAFVNNKAVTEGESDTGREYNGYVYQYMYGNF